MTCWHSNEDALHLRAGPVFIRYCRHAHCAEWIIGVEDVGALVGQPLPRTRWAGNGLEDYEVAAAEVARTLPGWDGAAFLYGLGGHRHEVDPTTPPSPRRRDDAGSF
jgi:hypothetical protein